LRIPEKGPEMSPEIGPEIGPGNEHGRDVITEEVGLMS